VKIIGHSFNGENGYELAILHRPDLILMDIGLGSGIDGIETATLIHREIEARILFLSASLDETNLERARKAGMHGYVRKPFRAEELQGAVTDALSRAA
jgi:DNA-binding NarL/FixJ family response regulator